MKKWERKVYNRLFGELINLDNIVGRRLLEIRIILASALIVMVAILILYIVTNKIEIAQGITLGYCILVIGYAVINVFRRDINKLE